MGIVNKVSQIATNVQQGAKTTSISLLGLSIKMITGFILGLTFALIGQEVIQYGTFMFVFMMVLVWGLVLRITLKWSIGSILIFDLICILVALLLRMYIIVAP
jgi:hypothetical protein